MISQYISELFQQAKQGLNDEQIQQIDEIWRELEGEVAAITASGNAEEAEASDVKNKTEEAENVALRKLILFLQTTVENLEKEIENKKQEGIDLERKRRFLSGAKVYPNEPCPCGSGKKYKKCCGLLANRADSPLVKEGRISE